MNRSTNPFLSMSHSDNNAGEAVDSQSFFENLLAKDYQSLSTNPFLYQDDLISGDSDTYSIDNSESTIVERENLSSSVEIDRVCGLMEDCLLRSPELDSPSASKDGPEKKESFEKYFDCRNWRTGEKISLRITTISNPSTFWVVPRYKELEYFVDYLHEIYSSDKKPLLPAELRLNINCVVTRKKYYYRGILVSFLADDENKVSVFLVDYGAVINVSKDQIYKIDDALSKVPHFSIRASLAFICPKNRSTWSSEVVNRFDSLTSNKILIGEVAGVDSSNKILELLVCLLHADGVTLTCVNKILLGEGYAQYIFENTSKYKAAYERGTPRYPYLYPSFEYIESGKALANIYSAEILKETISYDMPDVGGD